MRKFSILAVAAILGFPAFASAKDYATTGVIEVGGEVSFDSSTTTLTPDVAGADDIDVATTTMTVAPQVTYFLMDQLGLVGELRFSSTSTTVGEGDPSVTSGFGLGVGANYLLPVAGLHMGPQGTLGFNSRTTDDGTTETTVAGPALRLGGVVKAVFGEGGVLGAGLFITLEPASSISGDFEGDASTTGFGLGSSISVYW